MVQRVRGSIHPPIVDLPQLQINGIWATTLEDDPQNFLLLDNHDNNNRLIVFGSPCSLQKLSTSQRWFVDGNFAMAPRHFAQLYVIRVPCGSSAVTVVFALLQKKNQETYTQLFQTIVDTCVRRGFQHPAPNTVHCDFEIAAHQAVRQVLPQATIRGCFYHLTQVRRVL